jgi:hypothetical protein
MTEGVSLRQRLAVFSVALGTFTLVTNEFLPVALLTGIRTSLGVSQGAAATMVTVPALVAAIASPALAVAVNRGTRPTARGRPPPAPRRRARSIPCLPEREDGADQYQLVAVGAAADGDVAGLVSQEALVRQCSLPCRHRASE